MLSARMFGLHVTGSSGGEELVRCPFHDDKHSSAWFNPRKGLFWCAVCQLGLNADQLQKRLGLEIVDSEDVEHLPADLDLFETDLVLDLGQPIYADYFKERGVSFDVFQHYGLGWKDAEPQAAVFPVPNLMGVTTGTIYRYVDPSQTKTRYRKIGKISPVWPLNHLLGFATGSLVIVTEGIFSALRLASLSLIENVPIVSTLGAKANRSIIDVLQPFQPVFFYDDDTAGRTACQRMRQLAPLWQSWTLPTAPDDMNDNDIISFAEKLKKRFP